MSVDYKTTTGSATSFGKAVEWSVTQALVDGVVSSAAFRATVRVEREGYNKQIFHQLMQRAKVRTAISGMSVKDGKVEVNDAGDGYTSISADFER